MAIELDSCPETCVTEGATDAERVSVVVRVARMLRLLVHLLYGVAVLAVLVNGPRRAQHRFLKRWHSGVLRIAHVELVVTGPRTNFAPPGRPMLVVANHLSWLDVIALNAIQPLQLVSKAEVRGWPVIGRLAARIGTIFLDRTSYDDLRVVRKVVSLRLARGVVIGAFPEGTTTCGRGLGDVRPAMFQAALDVGCEVRPVALSYLDAQGRVTTAASFVGEMSLIASVWRVLTQRRMTLLVQVRPVVVGTQVRPMNDRRAVATAVSASITAAIRDGVLPTFAQERSLDCRAGVGQPGPIPSTRSTTISITTR